VVLSLKLRDPEALANGTGKRGYRRRTAGRKRRGPALSLLSLLLAFAGAGLILLLGGGVAMKQGAIGTDDYSSLAERLPLVGSAFTEPSSVEEEPGFDVEELQGRLEEIAGEHWGAYGVAVLEPISGTSISLRGDEEFVVASIGKLPVLAALYKAAARGELDLDEEISLRSSDIQGYGSGQLQAFPVGYSLSLRETAYYLVNQSDNTAWAMLDRRLGGDKVKAELENMGVKNSWYSDYHSGYFTTPNDVLLLLQKISDPEFTSEELSEEMLDAMTDTYLEDRIPEKLPSDVRVAHKTGSYGVNFGDAGVVFYTDDNGVERRYYLVVLTNGVGEYEARDVIQNMSLAVYEALTGTTVDPGWSRGKAAPLESAAAIPPTIQPDPAENPEKSGENAGRQEENIEPAKPLPDKTSSSSSESRRNAAPESPSNPATPSPSTVAKETTSSTPSPSTVAKETTSYSKASAPVSSKGYEDWYSKGYGDRYYEGYEDREYEGWYSKAYEDWEYGW